MEKTMNPLRPSKGFVQVALCVGTLLFAQFVAQAQVTVSQIRVTMSNSGKTVVWCNTTVAGCPNPIWNLGGPVALAATQTLVVTQTGLIAGVGGNFDTSDLASAGSPTLSFCSGTSPCTVQVELNIGSGLQTVYGPSAAGNPLNNVNSDPGGLAHEEAAQYVQVATAPSFTLSFGYADNEHSDGCPATGCFPSPFDGSGGTATATKFVGAGVSNSGICSTNCYDAGVILITALTAPPPPPVLSCVLTLGGYRNHFNNLVLNYPPGGLTIGGTFYTNAQLSAILKETGGGNTNNSLVLAQQLITAELNLFYGPKPTGSQLTQLQTAIAAANTLLTGINLNVGGNVSNKSLAGSVTAVLDAYNSGNLGVCSQ
jgi:hypothetical protein